MSINTLRAGANTAPSSSQTARNTGRPDRPRLAPVIMAAQPKGGTRKSTTLAEIIFHLMEMGHIPWIIDQDKANPDNYKAHHTELKCECIAADREHGFTSIARRISDTTITGPILISCGAGLVDVFKENAGTLDLAASRVGQLLVTWCVAALMPSGPYPVLAIAGEQGAGKSLLARLLRDLIDPSRLRLRALPLSERDLYIACSNTHVLAFDNLSRISDWLSDLFCTIATGGGIGLRENYSDDGEVYFEAERPIILTGIEDVVRRPDLADRAIVLTLPAIPEHERLDPEEFEARFQASRSEILGDLLDIMGLACLNLPTVKPDRLPRLAGFARLGIAIEIAFGGPGSFMAAYDANRAMASTVIAETDPLFAAVEAFHAGQSPWQGSATDLARLLESFIIPRKPVNPAALGGRLRRLAPILRARGIAIEFDRAGKGRGRLITLSDLFITT